MIKSSKIKASLSPLFEEAQTPLNIRIWPLIVWLLVSLEVGNYLSLLAPEEFRMPAALISAAATAAILLKPTLKLSKKKSEQ